MTAKKGARVARVVAADIEPDDCLPYPSDSDEEWLEVTAVYEWEAIDGIPPIAVVVLGDGDEKPLLFHADEIVLVRLGK